MTVNLASIVPVALVVTTADNEGALQLTEMEALTRPPSITLGWFLSVLHSRMLPIELLARPLAEIVTCSPLVKPVFGVMVAVTGGGVVAANDDAVVPKIVSPATTRAAAEAATSFEDMPRSRF